MSDAVHVYGRKTGRTTRMMEYAVEAASRGEDVYVVAMEYQLDELRRYAMKLSRTMTLKPRTSWRLDSSSGGSITFTSAYGLSTYELRPRGAAKDATVVIDHRALEQLYHRLIDEYHRWDWETSRPEECDPAVVGTQAWYEDEWRGGRATKYIPTKPPKEA